MKITGIHHCSIKVTDMQRAVEFYNGVLCLQEIEIPGVFVRSGLEVRWFQLGEEQLHLLPADAADEPSSRHFALHVQNAQVARAELRRHGIELKETTAIPGADRFFIHDPDENLIELIEWKAPYPAVAVGQ